MPLAVSRPPASTAFPQRLAGEPLWDGAGDESAPQEIAPSRSTPCGVIFAAQSGRPGHRGAANSGCRKALLAARRRDDVAQVFSLWAETTRPAPLARR